ASDEAAQILLVAIAGATGRGRETLTTELLATRDERAAPVFAYLVRHLNRKALLPLYLSSIEMLGSLGGSPGVAALAGALGQGEWWAPLRTRKARGAAAAALRKIGTPEAVEVLRAAVANGPSGARAAARAELERVG